MEHVARKPVDAVRNHSPRLVTATLSWALVALTIAACGGRTILTPNLQNVDRNSFLEQNAEVFHLSTNGLTVLLVPDRNTNLVKVDVRYPVGAMEDPEGKPGLAHLIEHVTFSTRHHGPEGPTLAQLLSRSALRYNAYTTHEETHYTSLPWPKIWLACLLPRPTGCGAGVNR